MLLLLPQALWQDARQRLKTKTSITQEVASGRTRKTTPTRSARALARLGAVQGPLVLLVRYFAKEVT
jgi:hypothetical protein